MKDVRAKRGLVLKTKGPALGLGVGQSNSIHFGWLPSYQIKMKSIYLRSRTFSTLNMHRPELVDRGITTNSSQQMINETSIGSFISLNTLLTASRTSNNNNSPYTDGNSRPSSIIPAEVFGNNIPSSSQPYNASFQGVSVVSSPPMVENLSYSNNIDLQRILEIDNLSSSEVSRVFQHWRSFLDPLITSQNNFNHSEVRSTSQAPLVGPFPVKSSRSEEAKKKHVYKLDCIGCTSIVSDRAMRSKLLADANCILYSTDSPMR